MHTLGPHLFYMDTKLRNKNPVYYSDLVAYGSMYYMVYHSLSSLVLNILRVVAHTVASESLFQSLAIRWLKVKANLNNSLFSIINMSLWPLVPCYCCRPIHPCLFGDVLPYFEVTGHPVPVFSPGLKCPDCFIWNCSYIVYPSKIKGPFRDNCIRYVYLRLEFLMA